MQLLEMMMILFNYCKSMDTVHINQQSVWD